MLVFVLEIEDFIVIILFLAYLDFTVEFIFDIDVSNYGIGVVLS